MATGEQENEKALRQHTTLLDIQQSEVDGRFASSKTFQRDYVVSKRKQYVDEGGDVSDDRKMRNKMETWREEAREIFIHDGDYKMYPDGTVEWLGEY